MTECPKCGSPIFEDCGDCSVCVAEEPPELPGFELRLVYTGDPHEERDWIFTFGGDQLHPITSMPLMGCYVRVRGTFATARDEMVRRFGTKWGFQYRDPEEAGVARYGLEELVLTPKDVEQLVLWQTWHGPGVSR